MISQFRSWQRGSAFEAISRLVTLSVCVAYAFQAGASESAATNVPEQPEVEEIVVTAQKREELLREVPISVDVIRGEKLDVLRSGAQDILFLSGRSPSLYAESSSGRIFPRFYVRG